MTDRRLQLFTNNAIALLASSLSPTDLTFSVQTGLGDLFPQPTQPGEWFVVTLESINAPLSREIIKVIGRSGDVLTIDPIDGRGFDDTTAQSWGANDTLVDHRLTAWTLKSSLQDSQFGLPTAGQVIHTGQTQIVNSMDITGFNRTCKWLVTVQTGDDRICMFEILGVFRPTGCTHMMYAKTGDRVFFDVNVAASASNMSLIISNTDTQSFIVDAMRLQHY